MPATDPKQLDPPITQPGESTEAALETISEDDAFRRALLAKTPFAFVTLVILLANIAVFAAMVATGVSPLSPSIDELIKWGANLAPRTFAGEEWRLLTHMFLHGAFWHLGMNMFALWSLGLFAERLFGNLGFALLYLFAGLAGGIASAADNPAVVSVGASGAIFGIAGALVGGCWRLRRSMPRTYRRATFVLAVNILVLFVVFIIVNRIQPMIDNMAHLAGLLVGAICGVILAEPVPNPGKSKRWLRNLVVAVLGSAACFLAIEQFSKPPAVNEETSSIEKLKSRFNSVEKRSLRRWETLRDQYEQKAISEEEYAERLETEVLPAWIDLRQKVEEAEALPAADREILKKAIKTQEDGCEEQVKRLRTMHWKKQEARFRELEKQVFGRLQILRQRLETGEIKESELADELHSEILPALQELRSGFLAAEKTPAAFQQRKAALLKIIELRTAGWQARVEAIRNNQPEEHDEADKLLNEAARLVRELNESENRD